MDLTPARIAAASTEYVHVTIQLHAHGEPVTPTSVDMALVTHTNTPEPEEWHEAELVGRTARLLVGPGETAALLLATGTYQVWTRWQAGHETPVYLLPRRLRAY